MLINKINDFSILIALFAAIVLVIIIMRNNSIHYMFNWVDFHYLIHVMIFMTLVN